MKNKSLKVFLFKLFDVYLSYQNNQLKRDKMKIYHRTTKKNAEAIIANGFQLKQSDYRVECGHGIYSFASMQDANSPYAKKTYGNYLVEFELCNTTQVERTDKVTAMGQTKAGIVKNWIYNISYLGDVVVLNDLSKIRKTRIV